MTDTKLLFRLMALSLWLLTGTDAIAHGFVSNPPARGYLCKQGGNSACGAIQWEPQSLEALSGFPAQGPADGHLASASLTQFGELDEQTSSRWAKTPMTAGVQAFTWTFTANHVTRNWRYYLTRPDWNPNQTLTRGSFELTPFCTAAGNLQRPAMTTVHQCQVPARTGYQVILAVWEVGDTAMSFYNVIDVLFNGAALPPVTWVSKGTIYPSSDLLPGDAVRTRVFDAQGERTELETRVTIASETEGKAAHWAYRLASQINAEQTLLKAGQTGANGNIDPVYGQNSVFVRGDSGLTAVEVQIEKAPAASVYELNVSGVGTGYPIQSGSANIEMTVAVRGAMEVSSYVYDAAGVAKAYASASLESASLTQTLSINPAVPGSYQLVVKAVPKAGGAVLQKTIGFSLTAEPVSGNYQYVFPDGLRNYQAGTRVLQPKTGRIYECKPWPYNGYCVQWSSGSNQFEPGVGSDWQGAWIMR